MKKLLVVLAAIVLFRVANATDYYFSSTGGNDSRTAAQAKSSATPWKTIAKLNAIFSTLLPGDRVLFKRGDSFVGTITVKKSGTATAPITIGAYGTGNKPIITSLVDVTGWVSKGNGIWESGVVGDGSRMSFLLVNGQSQRMGRWPNYTDTNQGYRTITAHTGTIDITDNTLTSAINWTGAEVVIRERRWVIDCDSITSHSGTKITYKANSSYSPNNGWGYFIQNSVKTLDKQGEWFYNRKTKKVSIYFGSTNPSTVKIQVPTLDNLLYSEKFSFVKLDNLDFRGSKGNNINLRLGGNVAITNCDINYSGNSGIGVFYTNKLDFENNNVSNSTNGGINLGYSPSTGSLIKNNKVYNSSVFAGGGSASGDGKGIGINVNCSDITIIGNEIKNSGFAGIYAGANSSNVTIQNNYIDSFNINKDDGGGIYTIIKTGNSMPSPIATNRKIIGNVVVNGIGASLGTWQNTGFACDGIYLDNGSANIEVRGNTVANVNHQGIFVHNSKNITIADNTFFNAKDNISFVENADHPQIRGCVVSGNISFAKTGSQSLLSYSTQGDGALYATYSNNKYVRPSDANNATVLTKIKTYDKNAALKTYTTPIRFEFNGTSADKTIKLDGTYADAKGVSYNGTITLKPYTSAVLIKTGTTTTPAPSTDTVGAVIVTSPKVNASYTSGSTVNISATIADPKSIVKTVQYWVDGKLIHTEVVYAWSWDWKNAPTGSHILIVKAIDSTGKVLKSSGNVPFTVKAATAARAVTSTKVDTATNFNFTLYPNPTISSINVNFEQQHLNEKADITIFDMSGRAMKDIPTVLSGKIVTIDVSLLNAGVYIVRVVGNNKSESQKFVKQ